MFLYQNPDICEQMGNASRQIAEQRFDVRLVNQVILRTMRIGNEAGSIVEERERGIICPSDEKVDGSGGS